MLSLRLNSRPLIPYLTALVSALLALFAVGILASGCSQATSSALGSLRVYVVGQDGTDLAGAKVVSDTQPEGQVKVTGMTDTGGAVSFTGLKPGTYEFYVSHFDYDQNGFSLTVRGDATSSMTVVLSKTGS